MDDRFREASGESSISYTQWEFLLAKSLNKKTYVYLTDKTFIRRQRLVEESRRSTSPASSPTVSGYEIPVNTGHRLTTVHS